MEEFQHKKIAELERRYSTDSIILLKALALFLPSDKQPELILFIKIMEIRRILQCRKQPSDSCPPLDFCDYEQVFAEIKPSLSKETTKKIEQLLQMVSAFQMYQQMKDLMEVLGPFSAAGDTSEESCGTAKDKEDSEDSAENSNKTGMNAGMAEMLKTMIPPENRQMLDFFMQMNQ